MMEMAEGATGVAEGIGRPLVPNALVEDSPLAATAPSKPTAKCDDDAVSLSPCTESSDRSSTGLSQSEKWNIGVTDDWRRQGSSESALSTGITSMCSSIAADDTAKCSNIIVSASKKRYANGSLKSLSEINAGSNCPPAVSTGAVATLTDSVNSHPPGHKRRGRPPKSMSIAKESIAKTSKVAKASRKSKSQAPATNVRPRSSIPTQLPAALLASQSLEAAYSSRLDPYALHPGEHKLLVEQITPKEVTIYLNIRNRILRLWKQNSLCSVTADEAIGCAKETRFFGLAITAYQWLVRHGYINFGCVEVTSLATPSSTSGISIKQRTVVVIGAGVSGLAAARQLEGLFLQEGYRWTRIGEMPPRVVIVEGRKRIGGRVYSKPLRSQVSESLPDGLRNTAEMGAMIVTGFERGNPLDTIIRAQLGLRYHLMRDALTIYDCDGKPVDEHKDLLNTELYTDISDRAGDYRVVPQKQETLKGDEELINRGRDPAPDGIIAAQLEPLMDGHIREHQPAARRGRRRNAPPGTEKLTGRSQVIESHSAKVSACRAARNMGWQMKDGASKGHGVSLHRMATATLNPTLGSIMDEAITQYQDLVSITPTDMRLLNWHHANMEYANAAPVTSLSLSGHDQDTGNEFEGAHSEIIGGYTQVPRGLMNYPSKLDVRFNHSVQSVHFDDHHPSNGPVRTQVVCTNGDILEADQVVVTVPLGVLKSDAIDFDPPLPSWKQGAIDRLGFGLLNKVSDLPLQLDLGLLIIP